MAEAKELLKFSEDLGSLKHLRRRGWVLRGMAEPERVAGHMYRMSVLAMTLDPIPGCDMNKVIKLCLIHDMAESRVGDITPHDNIPDEVKHQMEREAMDQITKALPQKPRDDLLSLYSEYEKHSSVEAKLTKDLDLFDMVHQAFEYEKKYLNEPNPPDLSEFYNEEKVLNRISNPQIQSWVKEIMYQRSLLPNIANQ